MIRPILAAGSIAAALAATPVMAQQQTPQQSPSTESPAAQPAPPKDEPEAGAVDPSLVGLVVYSSDGQRLGEVAEVGMAGGTPAVRVEMGEFLGLGSSSVIVNAKAIERKQDRVEIAMTAAEIKETIAKQRQQKKPD